MGDKIRTAFFSTESYIYRKAPRISSTSRAQCCQDDIGTKTSRRHNLYTRDLPPDAAGIAEYTQFLNDFMAEFRPETLIGVAAVETMAAAAWNRWRPTAKGTELLAAEIAGQTALHPTENPVDIFYRAYPALTGLFGRLAGRCIRQILRARAMLRREKALMKERTKPRNPACGPEAPTEQTSKMTERTALYPHSRPQPPQEHRK